MKRQISFSVFAALGIAGCTSPMTDLKLSESHPAHPTAKQATDPPLKPFLVPDTNQVLMKSVPASAGEPEHGHQHGTKPKSEEKK